MEEFKSEPLHKYRAGRPETGHREDDSKYGSDIIGSLMVFPGLIGTVGANAAWASGALSKTCNSRIIETEAGARAEERPMETSSGPVQHAEQRELPKLAAESPGVAPESVDDGGDWLRGSAEMESLIGDAGQGLREPHRGDVVEGVIAQISHNGILIDIGTKSEGVVPPPEAQSLIDEGVVSVGESVLVYVVQPENQEGQTVLSMRRAGFERGWRTAQRHLDAAETFETRVVDFNKGGLIVDADGVRGFVPLSQVVSVRADGATEEQLQDKLAAVVGQSIAVKVLEVNRKRGRLILSERQAAYERRGQAKEQLVSSLKEGEIRRGRVSSLTDFGAFVDLGGADGLIHLSELSWTSVPHARDILQLGDEIDVYVLGVDRENKKIALSLRRTTPEPWATAGEKYHAGDLVRAQITKLAAFGAFARLEDGIEGLVHISELSDTHVLHPRNVVKEGDVVTLRILRIEPERHRVGLSLRQADQEQDES